MNLSCLHNLIFSSNVTWIKNLVEKWNQENTIVNFLNFHYPIYENVHSSVLKKFGDHVTLKIQKIPNTANVLNGLGFFKYLLKPSDSIKFEKYWDHLIFKIWIFPITAASRLECFEFFNMMSKLFQNLWTFSY